MGIKMGEASKIIDNVVEDLKSGYTLVQLEEKYGIGVLDIFTYIAKVLGGMQGIINTVEALQKGEKNIFDSITNKQTQTAPALTDEENLIYAANARGAVQEDLQTHYEEPAVVEDEQVSYETPVEETQTGYEEEHYKTRVLAPSSPVAAPIPQETQPISNPSKVDWGSASLATPGSNEGTKML